MSKYQEVVEGIEARRKNTYNCIPTFFDRLSPYFPGIERKTYYLATASSGVGKSKLSRELAIYGPLKFLEEHPECDFTYKPFYFSLEETEEQFVLNGILSKLAQEDGIELDMMTLKGVGVNRHKLTDKVMEKIRAHQTYFEDLLTKVTFVDTIRNPTGIYYFMREYAWKVGKFYKKGVHVTDPKGSWDTYVPDNPKEIVMVMVDHYALLSTEKKEDRMMNLTETIDYFSNHYCIHMRNKLHMSIWGVQQQSADKERVEHTFKGVKIEEKLEPSLDGLGDSKKTQRDVDYAFGLFAPNRYDIPNHRGYSVTLLQDRYRSLSILKSREAPPGARIGLYFRGDLNTFEELPPAKEICDLISGEPDPEKYQKYLPQK